MASMFLDRLPPLWTTLAVHLNDFQSPKMALPDPSAKRMKSKRRWREVPDPPELSLKEKRGDCKEKNGPQTVKGEMSKVKRKP